MPPVACTDVEYGVATVPPGNTLGVICSAGGAVTVIESGAAVVAVCGGIAESTTFGVNVKAPAAVGVPLIWPDVLFSSSPGGNAPEAIVQVNGGTPPDVRIEVAYAEFLVAPSSAPLEVIDNAGAALILTV